MASEVEHVSNPTAEAALDIAQQSGRNSAVITDVESQEATDDSVYEITSVVARISTAPTNWQCALTEPRPLHKPWYSAVNATVFVTPSC